MKTIETEQTLIVTIPVIERAIYNIVYASNRETNDKARRKLIGQERALREVIKQLKTI